MACPSWGLTAVLLSLSVAACAPGGLVLSGESFDLAALGGKLGGTGDLRSTVERVALAPGEESDLAQYLRGPDGKLVDPAQVIWKSSQPSIVEVKQAGRVRAGATGTALLVAELTGPGGVQKAAIEVAVVEKHPVSLITVEPGKPKLRVGESLPLKATVRLADGQVNGDVAWSSSDPRIAEVNESGVLQARKEGSVTILATYKGDGRYRGLAEVEVVAIGAPLPSPSPSSITFAPGASALPTAAPSPVLVLPPSPTPTSATTPRPSPSTTATPRSYALRFDSGTQILSKRTDNLEFGPNGELYALSGDSADRRVSIYSNGTWKHIESIGTQVLRGQHWFNASNGIVVGNNGVCLRLTESNGEWSTKVLNPKTSSTIDDIYFVNDTKGYFCALGQVWRTEDGGNTWTPWGTTKFATIGNSRLVGTPTGEAVLSLDGGFVEERLSYRLSDSGISKLSLPSGAQLTNAKFGGNRLWAVTINGDGLYHTADLQSWTNLPGELETPTQILRTRLSIVFPFSNGAYMGTGERGYQFEYDLSFWAGPNGRNSDPSTTLSDAPIEVVSPAGDLYSISGGITRFRPIVNLNDLI